MKDFRDWNYESQIINWNIPSPSAWHIKYFKDSNWAWYKDSAWTKHYFLEGSPFVKLAIPSWNINLASQTNNLYINVNPWTVQDAQTVTLPTSPFDWQTITFMFWWTLASWSVATNFTLPWIVKAPITIPTTYTAYSSFFLTYNSIVWWVYDE